MRRERVRSGIEAAGVREGGDVPGSRGGVGDWMWSLLGRRRRTKQTMGRWGEAVAEATRQIFWERSRESREKG